MSSRTLLVSYAVMSGLVGLAACTESVTGPETDAETVEFRGLPFREYRLISVNNASIPTVTVEGECRTSITAISVPDSIQVDGGRLRLGDDRFELYYTWRGETDACTTYRVHWHRFASGRYATHEGEIAFFPEPDTARVNYPTWFRGDNPPNLEGRFTTPTSIEIDWGSLRLTFR